MSFLSLMYSRHGSLSPARCVKSLFCQREVYINSFDMWQASKEELSLEFNIHFPSVSYIPYPIK